MRIRCCAGLIATLLVLGACSGDEPQSQQAATTTTTTTTVVDTPEGGDSTSDDAPVAAAFADTGWCANQAKSLELDAQLRDADADTTKRVYAELLPLMNEFDAPAEIAGEFDVMIANLTAFSEAVTAAGLSNQEGLREVDIERLLFANDFLSASSNVYTFTATNC